MLFDNGGAIWRLCTILVYCKSDRWRHSIPLTVAQTPALLPAFEPWKPVSRRLQPGAPLSCSWRRWRLLSDSSPPKRLYVSLRSQNSMVALIASLIKRSRRCLFDRLSCDAIRCSWVAVYEIPTKNPF